MLSLLLLTDLKIMLVRMPVGNGREKTKGRSLDLLRAMKRRIVVKTAFLCLAHALIIALAQVNGEPK